jgi:hypothetical protein
MDPLFISIIQLDIYYKVKNEIYVQKYENIQKIKLI